MLNWNEAKIKYANNLLSSLDIQNELNKELGIFFQKILSGMNSNLEKVFHYLFNFKGTTDQTTS